MVFTEVFAKEVEIRPGRRLFVRKVSIGSANSIHPTLQLICVHGTCGTERQYHLFLESLDRLLGHKQQLCCLLFDSIGCGQSPSLKEWDAFGNLEVRADLEAIIQNHSNQTLPTVLVGHSYAPSIFLPLLVEKPKLISNLSGCILICTAVRNEHLQHCDGGHPIMKLPVFMLRCLQKQLTEGFVQIAVHPDHVVLKDAVRSDSNANDIAVAKAYHRQIEFATEEHLNAIAHVPTLILHGADDGVIPVQCGQHLKNSLPKSELVVIDRASHLVMLEKPDHVAEEVFTFIKKLL